MIVCMRVTMITQFNLLCHSKTIPCLLLARTGKNMFTYYKKSNRHIFFFHNMQNFLRTLVGPVIKGEINFFLLLFNRWLYIGNSYRRFFFKRKLIDKNFIFAGSLVHGNTNKQQSCFEKKGSCLCSSLVIGVHKVWGNYLYKCRKLQIVLQYWFG